MKHIEWYIINTEGNICSYHCGLTVTSNCLDILTRFLQDIASLSVCHRSISDNWSRLTANRCSCVGAHTSFHQYIPYLFNRDHVEVFTTHQDCHWVRTEGLWCSLISHGTSSSWNSYLNYRKISNISRTKSQNVNVSRLGLQLSWQVGLWQAIPKPIIASL